LSNPAILIENPIQMRMDEGLMILGADENAKPV
jgi:hypothetical protein